MLVYTCSPIGCLPIDAGDVALEKMWIQDEFFVSNKTLGEVCRILSKRYDVEIKVDDELEDKYRYTFTLRNETLEEIVRIMARINPIAYHFDEIMCWLSIRNGKIRRGKERNRETNH